MHRARRFAAAAYLLAALLVLFPVFDVVAAAWPIRLGMVNWRYGTVGLFSRVLVTPLLGLLLACGVAVALDQMRVLRVLAVLNGAVAVALLVVITLFMLDAVQLRAQAAEALRGGLDAASVIALTKYGLSFLVSAALAVGGWQASRSAVKHRKRRQSRGKVPFLGKRERSSTSPDPSHVDRSLQQTGISS